MPISKYVIHMYIKIIFNFKKQLYILWLNLLYTKFIINLYFSLLITCIQSIAIITIYANYKFIWYNEFFTATIKYID